MTPPRHGAGRGSRPRSLHPSVAQWDRIKSRARAQNMTVSRFLVRCALHEDPPPGDTDSRAGGGEQAGGLALTEAEQRELYENAKRQDECARAVLERLPGSEMSAVEALELLVGWYRALEHEREWFMTLDQDSVW